MKKNYIARLRPSSDPNEYFILTRGEEFPVEGLTGLALVRASIPGDNNIFKGDWSIIDIASGLFVLKDSSKKKLLQKWSDRISDPDRDFINAIIKARLTESYRKHVILKEDDVRVWRLSGYLIEGE